MVKVSLVKGEKRRETIEKSLIFFEEEIKKKLKSKIVLIKPNFVSDKIEKASTSKEQIRGILDFLKPFYRRKLIIAEGSAGDTFSAFSNFDYFSLKNEYPFKIEFVDLNKGDFIKMKIFYGKEIKINKFILDPKFFIISATKIKTHDTVIATLSLKNLAVGMIVGKDKEKIHQGIKEINQTLFNLIKIKKPDLASLDGFEAMEGEGPVIGDLIKLNLAIASLDPLAADRIALYLMGIKAEDVGYLTYCGEKKIGVYDLSKIEIVGEKLNNCFRRRFKLHSRIKEMLLWKRKKAPKGLGRPIKYE